MEGRSVEDVVILLGDAHAFQFRWRLQTRTLYHIPEWTQRYRKRWNGILAGTWPTVKILATELIRDNIESSIGWKNESYAVFGFFKGDPSMAFHAQAVSIFSGSVVVLLLGRTILVLVTETW